MIDVVDVPSTLRAYSKQCVVFEKRHRKLLLYE